MLVPSFAWEPTQDVLSHLARLEEAGRLAVVTGWLDAPLAMRVGALYATCRGEFSEDVRPIRLDPLHPKRLRTARRVEVSKATNHRSGPAIVIAGSAMLTGGRILHHLRAHLDEPSTTVVIVGFQPAGGLGRRLIDGATSVPILATEVAVKRRVAEVGGVSSHADRSELRAWAATGGADAEIRLGHGEPHARAARAARAWRAARASGAGQRLRRTRLAAVAQPSAVKLPTAPTAPAPE